MVPLLSTAKVGRKEMGSGDGLLEATCLGLQEVFSITRYVSGSNLSQIS